MSYKHAESTTPNNTFERYSFLVKATHKLNDWVDVAASVNFSNSTPRNAARNIGENFVNGTWTPNYDPQYFRNKYLGEHGGVASTDYGDIYGNVPGKPIGSKLINMIIAKKKQLYALLLKLI